MDGKSERSKLIKFLKRNWRREKEGAQTYRELAARERDENRKRVLSQLAEGEERHAERWARRLRELGSEPPPEPSGFRERFRRWVVARLGTEAALRRIEVEEERDIAAYHAQVEALRSPQDVEALQEVKAEEERHARVLRAAAAPVGPQSALEAILKREKWHVTAGGWIGQAIYGANDGLGAVFGIVSGVAGYTGGSHLVVVSGLAGMLASALSMGSGAYLATKSEREVYEAEMERERREIEQDPEEEQHEMELFYQLKGFTPEEAGLLARRLIQTPEQFLKTMAHEELGLSEAAFPNPLRAALTATWATAFGAFIPIIPFFFAEGMPAVIASFVISTVAHFTIGAAKVIVTGRSWVKSGTEMTVVGLAEAGITYGLGVLLAPPVH